MGHHPSALGVVRRGTLNAESQVVDAEPHAGLATKFYVAKVHAHCRWVEILSDMDCWTLPGFPASWFITTDGRVQFLNLT